MLGWWQRRRERKRFRPVVLLLPLTLRARYGGGSYYTVAQVQHAAEALKIAPELMPWAYTVGCTREAFEAAFAEQYPGDYARMRRELVELYDIARGENFTIKDLIQRLVRGVQNPRNDEVHLAAHGAFDSNSDSAAHDR